MVQFETPELDKGFKIHIKDDDVRELMIDFATRNGKYLKDQIARRIWGKHNLPMFRGTIVEEVPFQLKIDQILISIKEYYIAATYRFVPLS